MCAMSCRADSEVTLQVQRPAQYEPPSARIQSRKRVASWRAIVPAGPLRRPRGIRRPLRGDYLILRTPIWDHKVKRRHDLRSQSRYRLAQLCSALPCPHFLQQKHVRLQLYDGSLRCRHVCGSDLGRRLGLVPWEPLEIPRHDTQYPVRRRRDGGGRLTARGNE